MSQKAAILDAAVGLSQYANYRNVTRARIAEAAEVARGTVSYHFETMGKLQDAVMKEAVRMRLLPIIAQGLLDRNWYAMHAPADLKRAAGRHIAAPRS